MSRQVADRCGFRVQSDAFTRGGSKTLLINAFRLCVRSVFVESALPGPRCPWFPGHSLVRERSRGMTGVAGDAGVVAVPQVTVPGTRGAAAGARRETWRPGVAGVPAPRSR
ncbi:unnamed protein product [Boreogadus saida]